MAHKEAYKIKHSEPLAAETPIRPTLTLSHKDFPVIEYWKVGGTYKIELEVKQTAYRKSEYMEHPEASFDILSVKDVSDKKVSEMSSHEFNEKVAKYHA